MSLNESITVCIPCYNQHHLLPRALDSVYKQTKQPKQILVIDDGSATPVIVDDPRVKVIRVTNRGLPAARNVALMNTTTTAFLPLDADDWLHPDYLAKTWPLLTRADVVLTGIQEVGPIRNGSYKPGFNMDFADVTAEIILDTFNRFYYCSLFRTSTLKAVGGYNPKMNEGLEDADLWVDLLRRGAKFRAVPDPLFYYSTENPDGMLNTIQRNGGYQRMVEEMRRHHA